MGYKFEDYTFSGLLNNNSPTKDAVTSIVKTLTYIIGLTTSSNSDVLNIKVASHNILNLLYDVEEQVQSAQELLEAQRLGRIPAGYFPQTPVMLAREWSPISAMLGRGMEPVALSRADRPRMSCASGIWNVTKPVESKEMEDGCSDEDLFWHVLAKVVGKAKEDRYLISIIAVPGLSYEDYEEGAGRIDNLTLEEAKKADRVIWQRTPKRI